MKQCSNVRSWQRLKKEQQTIDKAQKRAKDNEIENEHMTFRIIFYLNYIDALVFT